ncbi:MAG TPA: hypothetical protein VKB95_13465 [Chitinophagaceae bacterium]|nr:hypothetical protein [Chitinophagaceae bacterium]
MSMIKRIYFLFIVLKYLFIPLSAQTPVIAYTDVQTGIKSDRVFYSVTGIDTKADTTIFAAEESSASRN